LNAFLELQIFENVFFQVVQQKVRTKAASGSESVSKVKVLKFVTQVC